MASFSFKSAAAAAALTLAAGGAAQAETILKVHHFLPSGSSSHQKIIAPWCAKVEKESGGELKCQIYPAMQLGGTPPQLLDQVRDGVADIVWSVPTYPAGRYTKSEVFELPFMAINAKPFRPGAGTELGGDATSADLGGINVALGQHGAVVRPWNQASTRLILQLANYYLADTNMSEKDRADYWLDVAVLCYESGGFKLANQYAGQAVGLDAGLKPKVRQLMPDILPD